MWLLPLTCMVAVASMRTGGHVGDAAALEADAVSGAGGRGASGAARGRGAAGAPLPLCGLSVPAYGTSRPRNALALGSGGNGEVHVVPLPLGRGGGSSFVAAHAAKRGAAPAVARKQVKNVYANHPTYILGAKQEVAAGMLLCSAASSCPAGMPVSALLGVESGTSDDAPLVALFEKVDGPTLSGVLSEPQMHDSLHKYVALVTHVPPPALSAGAAANELAQLRELDAALVIIQQLALGLQHLSERGFIHNGEQWRKGVGGGGRWRSQCCTTNSLLPSSPLLCRLQE